MAIMHFRTTSISRGAGRSAVAAAAYRSGERLRDERTGRLHNYSKRTDVSHKEILLPSGLDRSRLDWVQDRVRIWNNSEQAENRRDARVAREFQVSLPYELSADRRRELAQTFSQQVADRYRVVVDLAIHAPRPDGDPRNHHAHVLFSSREITADGFGAKAGLDADARRQHQSGLPVGIAEIRAVRERWANLTNEALWEAGVDARIDHRSLRAQGIDRVPGRRLSIIEFKQLRRSVRPEVQARIDDRHQARVAAREQPATPVEESSIEALKRQAREAWQRMRYGLPKESEARAAAERGAERSGRDHDHEL
jgi:hypothetical protein